MNDLNAQIEQIIALYDSGGDPNKVINNIIQKNPMVNQLGTQYKNMSEGRNPKEFLLQLARQSGVSEQNIQGLARILGVK
jgi:hypothetical protein